MSQSVDLSPQIVNIIVTRGDAWALAVVMPFDLTGYTIASQLRARADATDFVDLDIAPNDLAAGSFSFGQQEATTGGVYDVQVTPPSGLPRTYVAGLVTVRADVTR